MTAPQATGGFAQASQAANNVTGRASPWFIPMAGLTGMAANPQGQQAPPRPPATPLAPSRNPTNTGQKTLLGQ